MKNKRLLTSSNFKWCVCSRLAPAMIPLSESQAKQELKTANRRFSGLGRRQHDATTVSGP